MGSMSSLKNTPNHRFWSVFSIIALGVGFQVAPRPSSTLLLHLDSIHQPEKLNVENSRKLAALQLHQVVGALGHLVDPGEVPMEWRGQTYNCRVVAFQFGRPFFAELFLVGGCFNTSEKYAQIGSFPPQTIRL